MNRPHRQTSCAARLTIARSRARGAAAVWPWVPSGVLALARGHGDEVDMGVERDELQLDAEAALGV